MSFLQKGPTLKDLLQNPELLNLVEQRGKQGQDGKKIKEVDVPRNQFSGQSAFLGQQLWDKTLPYDVTGDLKDFKLEYMDLDEFLSENCIPSSDELNQLADVLDVTNSSDGGASNTESELMLTADNGNLNSSFSSSPQPPQQSNQLINPTSPRYSDAGSELLTSVHSPESSASSTSSNDVLVTANGGSPNIEVNYEVNPSDLELARVPGDEGFDPRNRAFSEEELRPQPLIKKSRKIFVPDDCKDEKYWTRRNKNNVAAKRSREARRIKENQITLRAGYLEKENDTLKDELTKIKEENKMLKLRLKLYEK